MCLTTRGIFLCGRYTQGTAHCDNAPLNPITERRRKCNDPYTTNTHKRGEFCKSSCCPKRRGTLLLPSHAPKGRGATSGSQYNFKNAAAAADESGGSRARKSGPVAELESHAPVTGKTKTKRTRTGKTKTKSGGSTKTTVQRTKLFQKVIKDYKEYSLKFAHLPIRKSTA